jgi:UDP-N-acetylglucosamine 2-epimerase (non-hydrolysing)
MTGDVVDVVIGTRPEAIKLAPVAHELARRGVATRLVITGQHDELVDSLLDSLCLREFNHTNFRVMRPGQPLNFLAARLLKAFEAHLETAPPSIVLVQGDTTSAFVAALAAFHKAIPVGHVEAGLRSGKPSDPFPEEMNRTLISRIARWHFCPTASAANNLVAEGIEPANVMTTGNTVIDALQWIRGQSAGSSAFASHSGCKVLVTMHRRENQGLPMFLLADALATLADELKLNVVLPMHPSPAVRSVIEPAASRSRRILLMEPLGYVDFVATLADASIVITDSGGVLEEAAALGTAALVVRNSTERPEAVWAGVARLIGTNPRELGFHLRELVLDNAARTRMASAANPFGDGRAAVRIVDRLVADLELASEPVLSPSHHSEPVPS